jgi:hypothetical protein
VSRAKLSVPAPGGLVPHAHSHAFRTESDAAGPARLVAAPDRGQVALLLELARTLPGPFLVIYVLLSTRGLRPTGRYQTTRPISGEQLEGFLAEYREFLEQDGRHHLWIGSAVEPSTLVYDQHQVLYLYGRLEAYAEVLRRAGMDEGPVEIPVEHRHESHDEFDATEHRLMGHFMWTWNPLEPDDEALD